MSEFDVGVSTPSSEMRFAARAFRGGRRGAVSFAERQRPRAPRSAPLPRSSDRDGSGPRRPADSVAMTAAPPTTSTTRGPPPPIAPTPFLFFAKKWQKKPRPTAGRQTGAEGFRRPTGAPCPRQRRRHQKRPEKRRARRERLFGAGRTFRRLVGSGGGTEKASLRSSKRGALGRGPWTGPLDGALRRPADATKRHGVAAVGPARARTARAPRPGTAPARIATGPYCEALLDESQ